MYLLYPCVHVYFASAITIHIYSINNNNFCELWTFEMREGGDDCCCCYYYCFGRKLETICKFCVYTVIIISVRSINRTLANYRDLLLRLLARTAKQNNINHLR